MKIFIAILISAAAAPAQVNPGTPVPSGRIQIKQLPTPGIPIEPEQEAGDSVAIGADGTIRCSSRGRSYDLVLDNRISPTISLSYSAEGGRVHYRLRVENGVDAVQSIGLIRIGVPSLPGVVAPPPWSTLRAWGGFIGIARLTTDDDQTGRLSPGKGLDLSFSSENLPGLVSVELFTDSRPDPAYGAFFNWASPWVQQQMAKLDTRARNRVSMAALGPVTPMTSDSAGQIRDEIVAAAARYPEFAGFQASLAALPVSAGKRELSKWVHQWPEGSRAGIAGAFLDALDWRLNRLP